MSEKLKSCPFCGGEAKVESWNCGKEGFKDFVKCENKCTELMSPEAWNTRVNQD